MIGRYQTKEMTEIWSEENKFRAWLEVELAVCRVWMEKGVIPADAYEEISSRPPSTLHELTKSRPAYTTTLLPLFLLSLKQ